MQIFKALLLTILTLATATASLAQTTYDPSFLDLTSGELPGATEVEVDFKYYPCQWKWFGAIKLNPIRNLSTLVQDEDGDWYCKQSCTMSYTAVPAQGAEHFEAVQITQTRAGTSTECDEASGFHHDAGFSVSCAESNPDISITADVYLQALGANERERAIYCTNRRAKLVLKQGCLGALAKKQKALNPGAPENGQYACISY